MSSRKQGHRQHSAGARSESDEHASTRGPDQSASDARNLRPRRGASRPLRTCRLSESARKASAASSRKPSLPAEDPFLPGLLPTAPGLTPLEPSPTPGPTQTHHEDRLAMGPDSPARQRDASSPPRRAKSESPPKRQPERSWFAVSPSSTVAHAIAGGSPLQAPPCYPMNAADNAARASYEAVSEHFKRFPARSREELGDRVALLRIIRQNQLNLSDQIIHPY